MWGIGSIRSREKDRSDENRPFSRHSLSQEDRQLILAFVRTFLRSDRLKGEPGELNGQLEGVFLPDADRPVTLSVAFWVSGMLRGCRIVHRQPLKEALRQATFQAMRDSRFKPIGEKEFDAVRIEIVFLVPSEKMPVYRLRGRREIDPEKAYRVSYEGRQGWLLPEVFNCLRFRGMDDFLKTLITEKAGLRIDRRCLTRAEIEVFTVDDFIESEEKNQVFPLSGPLVVMDNHYRYDSFDERFISDLETMSHQAASQLLGIQEEDGNIPPVINPLSGKMRQVDWVRLALTAVALESFGKSTETEKYRVAGRKAGEYIWKYGYDHPYLDIYTRTLCRVYYAEYLFVSGREEEAKSIAWELLKQVRSVRFEPIFLLKAASLLLSFEEKEFLRMAEGIFGSVWDDFIRKREYGRGTDIELARFPELIVVAEKLFVVTRESRYREKGIQITEWFISQQHAQGSFPSVIGSRFSYTRGTGKIFEVLAFHPNEYRESLLRIFGWLRTMQYSRENTFFIRPEHRRKVLGGFRHDVFNHEVWIDASSHVLLGGSRILQAMKRRDSDGVFERKNSFNPE